MSEFTQPNPMETGGNPEQQIRQELLHNIVADSIGTVGLYTTADFSPEDRAHMQAAQESRTPGRGVEIGTGWSEYGERPISGVAASESAAPEKVAFVPQEDGKIDIRYSFTQPGYTDSTGRPGNSLNVHFKLSRESASKLDKALHADPNFMNEVVKAQATALGVSNEHWDRHMKPHYIDRFKETVAQKDRVLSVEYMSGTGNVEHTEPLTYGENKSLMSMGMQSSESSANPSPEVQNTPQAEQEPALSSEEASELAWEENVRQATEKARSDAAELRASGKSLREVITELENSSDETNQMIDDPNLTEEQSDNLFAVFTGEQQALRELLEEEQKTTDTHSARKSVEEAYKQN